MEDLSELDGGVGRGWIGVSQAGSWLQKWYQVRIVGAVV